MEYWRWSRTWQHTSSVTEAQLTGSPVQAQANHKSVIPTSWPSQSRDGGNCILGNLLLGFGVCRHGDIEEVEDVVEVEDKDDQNLI